MKKFNYQLLILTLILSIYSSCKKNNIDPDASKEESYEVTFYKVTDKNAYNYDDYLQSSIIKGDIQIATFGEIGDNGLPGNFNKLYAYDKNGETEAIILLDENHEPAYIYSVDLATGKKQEFINEFERIDNDRFYYRILHYDWTNRIGTLLFETVITNNNGDYASSPSFVIDELNLGTLKNAGKQIKRNRSFYMPISRLDYYQKAKSKEISLKSANFSIEGFRESFDEFRNSEISDWLVKSRKAGAAATLVGLGLSTTVVGSPAGLWLVAGGMAMVLGSTAIEMAITHKWINSLKEIDENISSNIEGLKTIGNNIVNIEDGYSADLKNWLNEKLHSDDVEDLLDKIQEEEIITDNANFDDLPDSNGVLHIGLSWNTQGSDLDLWVTDPFNETINYDKPESATGGYLDRDDVDGLGPENVYWSKTIPNGKYTIKVHYYDCDANNCPVTNYTVKISNGLGYSETVTGTLSSVDQVNQVVSFVVNGKRIN